MNKKIFKVSLIVLLAFGLTSAGFAQRQTGSIHGTVIDEEGTPIPGASVAASSPKFLGIKSYVTGKTGKFRFPALVPGEYEIKVEMPGFKTTITKGLLVKVGKTTSMTVTLEMATIEEEVTVVAESPVVDIESSKISVSYGAEFIATIPMSRDLYDIQNSIPGAISEGTWYRRTSSILGGTVRSQLYALDGVAMNDPATFYSMVNINVDVYEEIEFEIGAHPAEVGQTDGTYINIVTKSGGNKFSGGATLYYTGESMAQDLWTEEELIALGVDVPSKYTDYKDISLNFGGPIIKDRIWFFVNGRRQIWARAYSGTPENRLQILADANPGVFSAEQLQHYDFDHQEWLAFAKLTFQLTKNIRYMGMIHYNHIYEPIYSNRYGTNVSWDATAVWDHENSYATSHQFNWVLNQNTFLDIRGNYLYRYFPILTRPEVAGNYYNYDSEEKIYWGNTSYSDEYWRRKMVGSVSLTRFQDEFLGASHEFKAGFEYEHTEYDRDWYKLGNPYYTYYDDYNKYMTGDIEGLYYHDIGDREGRVRLRACPDEPRQWLVQDHTNRYSGYVQDSITTGKFAFNLGVRLDHSYQYEPEQSRPELRYDMGPEHQDASLGPNELLEALIQEEHDRGYATRFDALTAPYRRVVEFTTLSPRIGVVYDIFGNGKTALKASFARYYEPVWSAKYNATNIFGAQTQIWRWFDDNADGDMDLPGIDHYDVQSRKEQDPSVIYYTTFESIQKYWETGNEDDLKGGLKAPYMHEFLAGVEHELVRDFKLGFQFVYKVNKNIVESVDKVNGYDWTRTDEVGPIWIPYDFVDPGWDGEWETGDKGEEEMTIYALRRDRDAAMYLGTNPPEAIRKYWAFILTFDKRMSNNWQLKGSVLYSSFKGNCRAGYGYTEGEESYFDEPTKLINNYGPLPFDRPLQIKIMGTVILPYDIIISAYFQHRSGSAMTREFQRVYFPTWIEYPVGSGVEYRRKYSYEYVMADPRGSTRNSSFTNMDLRVEKSISFGKYGKLNFYADIFNVAGRKSISVNDDPYARIWYYRDPPEYTLSTTYGDITSVSGVRSFRLGMRWSF
ncbi:TonB-dependent receptor [Candidatus Aerophobetes bacterium]|uniref:TonB-dependent receptor n=1 Tax=Aerophobetes bacterium TaxID=2030807 RepID=A0A523YPP8_UNCAE|nr:MAG: TonB-dependent receptor [Candidatus Aerophobetes bacterium]